VRFTGRVRVLFVCTANICRSPTAEGLLRRRLRERGWQHRVEVDSAGISRNCGGAPPDPRACAAARDRGVAIEHLRARRVDPLDLEYYDLVLVMERGQLRWLQERAPAHLANKIRLLMTFAGAAGGDEVPDPYFGGVSGFARAVDLLAQGVDGVFNEVARRLRESG